MGRTVNLKVKQQIKSKFTEENKKKWLFILIAISIFIIFSLIPNPEGLSRTGQQALAVFAFTITLWIT